MQLIHPLESNPGPGARPDWPCLFPDGVRAALKVLLLLLLGLALSGCVTAKKYKLVKQEAVRPVQKLDWATSTEAADLALQSVIVFKGPGSWKREARWDEYAVTVTNRGTEPLVIEEAVLVDLLHQPQLPGVDPWKLERLSHTNWDKYGKAGLKLVAGAGAVVLYGGAVVATSMGGFMAGGAAAGGGAAALSIIPVVAVVDITAVAIMNNQNKKKVVAEFNRRRLGLPLTIGPGESKTGSLFFPMTPAPRQLRLIGRQGSREVRLVLDLAPLADLHLKPAAGKTTSP